MQKLLGSGYQDQSQIYGEFEVSVGHIRACLKNKTKQKTRWGQQDGSVAFAAEPDLSLFTNSYVVEGKA